MIELSLLKILLMNATMIDPDKLTVREKKLLGMWPPQDSVAHAITPYIKRMSGEIDVLDIGVGKGENIVYLHENAPNISKIYGLSHSNEFEEILVRNMEGLDKVDRQYDHRQTSVVMVSMNDAVNAELLSMYYAKVKPSGIFAGDFHTEPYVKEALSKFRRKDKIGHPIQVVNRTIWFWKK
jgi:SAM-dependent methyltransferase